MFPTQINMDDNSSLMELSRFFAHDTQGFADLNLSMYLLKTAAMQGYAPACKALGQYYEFGNNLITIDLAQALIWYERATQDKPECFLALARVHQKLDNKNDVIKMYQRCLQTQRDAVITEALRALGRCFKYGKNNITQNQECYHICKKLALLVSQDELNTDLLPKVFANLDPVQVRYEYATWYQNENELISLLISMPNTLERMLSLDEEKNQKQWDWLIKIRLQPAYTTMHAILALVFINEQNIEKGIKHLQEIQKPSQLSENLAMRIGCFYYGWYVNERKLPLRHLALNYFLAHKASIKDNRFLDYALCDENSQVHTILTDDVRQQWIEAYQYKRRQRPLIQSEPSVTEDIPVTLSKLRHSR